MYNFLSQFGFGKKTGLDMEGEVSGLMPSQEWKMKRYKQKWYTGDTVSAGIGQGYDLTTPMQLASPRRCWPTTAWATAPIWCGRCSIAQQRHSHTGSETGVQHPLNPEHVALVKSAMLAVMQPGGTAAQAGAGASYSFAGKTGTAQVVGMKQGEKYDASQLSERNRDHAWFIGFAPQTNPGSRWPCWRKTAVTAVPSRHPSRARCWTTTCSARCRPSRHPLPCSKSTERRSCGGAVKPPSRSRNMIKQDLWPRLKRRLMLHIDPILMLALGLLLMAGLVVLYSATDATWGV